MVRAILKPWAVPTQHVDMYVACLALHMQQIATGCVRHLNARNRAHWQADRLADTTALRTPLLHCSPAAWLIVSSVPGVRAALALGSAEPPTISKPRSMSLSSCTRLWQWNLQEGGRKDAQQQGCRE